MVSRASFRLAHGGSNSLDKRLKRVLSFGLAWAGAPGVVVGGLTGAMATSLSGAIACFSSSAEAKRLVSWACCLEDVAVGFFQTKTTSKTKTKREQVLQHFIFLSFRY